MDGSDAIICTKRYASDEMLSQPPVLALPKMYLDELPEFPKVPRPLPQVKSAKRQHYLALCELLLTQAPSESTRRSVQFLVSCFNTGWFLPVRQLLTQLTCSYRTWSRLSCATVLRQLRYQTYHGLKKPLGSGNLRCAHPALVHVYILLFSFVLKVDSMWPYFDVALLLIGFARLHLSATSMLGCHLAWHVLLQS